MAFDLTPYSKAVTNILTLDGAGNRPMPLVSRTVSSPEAAGMIRAAKPGELFPDARSPMGALAGLWLYFSAFEEAHGVAQDLATAEGSYWHAILHRQEPDPGNSGYWFRRVGQHVIFSRLRDAAEQLGYTAGPRWDPFAFIDYCETARRKPGSPQEQIAIHVQLAEWQLLFEFCALPVRT